MELRRSKIHFYGEDYTRGKFGKFVEFKALVLKLALDSTPMRMSECTGDARSMDIHARFTEARAASGERMGFFLN